MRSTGASKRAIALSPIRVHQRASAVQKCDRPVRQKERSTFPPSASIRVSLRFKSAIGLSSKRAIALSPVRVHLRISAVQKGDRPYVKKSDRPFPHPRPSACICGSKVRPSPSQILYHSDHIFRCVNLIEQNQSFYYLSDRTTPLFKVSHTRMIITHTSHN